MRRVLVVAASGSSNVPRLQLASWLERALAECSWRVLSCRVAGDPDGGVARVLGATRRLLSDGPALPKPILILLADEPRQGRIAWALVVAGLRPAVELVLHVRAAAVPIDPSLADLFAAADLVVAESRVGIRAVQQCLAEGGVASGPQIVAIPQAVPPPAEPAALREVRDQVRRGRFGVEPEDLLVGCLAGSEGDHRQLLARRIFRIFADGLYSSCELCGALTVLEAQEGEPPVPDAACQGCGAQVQPGRSWPRARLYLSRPRAGRDRVGRRGSCSDASLPRLEPLEGRVFVEDVDLQALDSDPRLRERLSCLDVHLLPHHLADVEPVLLTSCALGVPAVTTRFGAAEELLDGAARLVTPRITLDDPSGHRIAIMDARGAVRELLSLAQDAEARSDLGARARQAMRSHHRGAVLRAWVGQLERLAAG